MFLTVAWRESQRYPSRCGSRDAGAVGMVVLVCGDARIKQVCQTPRQPTDREYVGAAGSSTGI